MPIPAFYRLASALADLRNELSEMDGNEIRYSHSGEEDAPFRASCPHPDGAGRVVSDASEAEFLAELALVVADMCGHAVLVRALAEALDCGPSR